MSADTLAQVRVVLVESSHPGNIGAAARAMKGMGLSRLALVRPQGFPSAEATARASGADDLLQGARVVDDLPGAIADCGLVIGTSARARTLAWPEVDARTGARLLLAAAGRGPVAVVFGRERWGLTNAEVDHCRYLLRIPCNPAFSSLNLAAAVQVVAYELWMAARSAGEAPGARTEEREREGGADHPAGADREQEGGADHPAGADREREGGADRPDRADREPVGAAEMEGLIRHFEETAVALGFLDPQAPKRLVRRLRRLFYRAAPDQTEVNILRGFLKAAQLATRRGAAGDDLSRVPASHPHPDLPPSRGKG
jgi:tRNA/rRNA methyltransferase/tRNA (cytidine32/uridine32-2'-O)-methyltransferase